MTINELKQKFHEVLDVVFGAEEVRSLYFIALEHELNVSRTQFAIKPNFKLSEHQIQLMLKVLKALERQKPIQYILGETEFYNSKFKVNPAVLIPRPETEELVALIISDVKRRKLNTSKIRILDIGTGSGCIAISLAKYIKNAEVYAIDVSGSALALAQLNAESNGVNINFSKLDILEGSHWNLHFNAIDFDLIVSNPPYVTQREKRSIKPNVLNYEPHLALFVTNLDPLKFYRAIIDFSLKKLKLNGMLYFELNQYYGQETKQLLTKKCFEEVELIKDLNGNDRILKAKRSKI